MRKIISRVILCILITISLADALSFILKASRENPECFYDEISAGVRVTTFFQVKQEAYKIGFEVKAMDGKIMFSEEGKSEGKNNFNTRSHGTYSFCFWNPSKFLDSPREVTFLLDKFVQRSRKGQKEAEENSGPALEEHINPLEEEINHLYEGIVAVIEEQQYMKVREKTHRDTSESTNQRVVWWSLFEVIALLTMSGGQVYYLRKFFEVRRIV